MMPLFNAVPPPPELTSTPKKPSTTSTTSQPRTGPPPPGHVVTSPVREIPIDIDAWTLHALESLSVSPLARGTRSPLSINIDEQRQRKPKAAAAEYGKPRVATIYVEDDEADEREPIRRPPSRRDSQRKREMVLKGKEGSRQRRRWENDRLMHVPNVQPPLPSDWQPHPTHPIHHIPYALASYWDQPHRSTTTSSKKATIDSLQKLHLDRTSAFQAASKRAQLARGTATGFGAGEVPRDLREAAKRSHVVKVWVRDLEGPIREWVMREREEEEEEVGSDEEEIFFKGRVRPGGDEQMAGENDTEWNKSGSNGMVLDAFGDVENASFKYGSLFTLRSTTLAYAFNLSLLRLAIPLHDPSGSNTKGRLHRLKADEARSELYVYHPFTKAIVGDLLLKRGGPEMI